jgi:hypothetical protein
MITARLSGRVISRLVSVAIATGFVAISGAQGQSLRIFVASFGNDANDGSRGSPKRNFQAAHDAGAPGGEIVALDTAGYGALSINKSVGVTAPAGITGFITATVTSNVAIIIGAATTDTVTLRGLTLNSVSGGISGIRVDGVGTLEVDGCVINGFSNAGISFSSASAARLVVKDSTLRENSDAIVVQASAATVKWVIAGCRLESNGVGLNVLGSTSAHRVEVRDTFITGNSTAVRVENANSRVALQGCTLSANTFGLSVPTSGATAKVDDCVITNNGTGLSRVGGAQLLSRGNNTVENNITADGTFSGTYSAK